MGLGSYTAIEASQGKEQQFKAFRGPRTYKRSRALWGLGFRVSESFGLHEA